MTTELSHNTSAIAQFTTFTSKNFEITPSLKDFTLQKLIKLQRHADHIIHIQITFEVQKLRQIAKASLQMPGEKIHATQASETLYKSIDQLIDKLISQINTCRKK